MNGPNGDLCMVNAVFFDREIGAYFQEVRGLVPDTPLTREYIGSLSKFRFVARFGFVIWLVDLISLEKFVEGLNV